MKQREFKLNKLLKSMMIGGCIAAIAPAVIAAEEVNTDDVEVIQVKGFRGSLNKAVFEKRASTNVKDSIMAEDIGKFPDLNIAESLQRVPGVAISREGGEGRQITLRGLGPNYTRTTLNGMEVPASTDGTDSGGGVNSGRGVDFNVFASELFNRVDVQKSSTASTEEGGIAGTVDLYSAKPMDNPGMHVAASGQLGYNDLSGEKDPRVALMFSNTFADDTLGVLLSVAKSERTVRQEGFGTVRWTTPVKDGTIEYANLSYDQDLGIETGEVANGIDGDYAYDECTYKGVDENGMVVDINTHRANCLWTPRLPRPDFFGNKQDRLGITGSFQYAPSDKVKLTLDVLKSKLENDRTMYNMFEMFRSTFDEITPTYIKIAENGRQIEAATFDNVYNRIESRNQVSETDFSQYVLSGEFNLSDSLSLHVMAGTAESDARSEQYRYNLTSRYAHTVGFDFGGNSDAPEMDYGYDYNAETVVVDGQEEAAYMLNDGRLRATDMLRENDTAKLDLTYEGDTFTIKTGLAYNDRNVAYQEEEIKGFPDQADARGYTTAFPYSDFGTGFDGAALPKFIVADFDAIEDQLLVKDWVLRGKQSWDVNEETMAAYVEADASFDVGDMVLRSNFGLRGVKTTTTSGGYIGTERVSIENSYTNLLPALNLALDVTDDLVVRAAASKTMTRASLNSLNPGNPSFSYVNATVSAGNPDLNPIVATNLDLGVEWYFNEESLLAAGAFYKDMQDTISRDKEMKYVDEAYWPFMYADEQYDPVLALDPAEHMYEHSVPLNLGSMNVKGLELIYRQHFGFLPAPFDGLGMIANYTWVDTSAEITGLSENSYNGTLYYEKDNYGVRFSINKRDDYITDFSGSNGNAQHATSGPTHVDMSAFYNLTDQISFSIEGINLTDEHERLYTTGDGDLNLMREYNHTGRQLFFGVRYVM